MDAYMFIVRLVHIFAAIFWMGTTLFMVAFLEPVIQALGPDGSKVMQKLSGGTRFPLAIALGGWITVIAGVLLYWPFTGFSPAVMFGARLPLTIGALAGILAGFTGTLIQGRDSGQLTALGKKMATQGGPPSPEQLAQVGVLQHTIQRGSRLSAFLMVVAVIGMVI